MYNSVPKPLTTLLAVNTTNNEQHVSAMAYIYYTLHFNNKVQLVLTTLGIDGCKDYNPYMIYHSGYTKYHLLLFIRCGSYYQLLLLSVRTLYFLTYLVVSIPNLRTAAV